MWMFNGSLGASRDLVENLRVCSLSCLIRLLYTHPPSLFSDEWGYVDCSHWWRVWIPRENRLVHGVCRNKSQWCWSLVESASKGTHHWHEEHCDARVLVRVVPKEHYGHEEHCIVLFLGRDSVQRRSLEVDVTLSVCSSTRDWFLKTGWGGIHDSSTKTSKHWRVRESQ